MGLRPIIRKDHRQCIAIRHSGADEACLAKWPTARPHRSAAPSSAHNASRASFGGAPAPAQEARPSAARTSAHPFGTCTIFGPVRSTTTSGLATSRIGIFGPAPLVFGQANEALLRACAKRLHQAREGVLEGLRPIQRSPASAGAPRLRQAREGVLQVLDTL